MVSGTKVDLRQEQNLEHVTEQEGKKLKRKIKATAYVECSAKEMFNLETIFITAVRAAVRKTHTKRVHQCVLL